MFITVLASSGRHGWLRGAESSVWPYGEVHSSKYKAFCNHFWRHKKHVSVTAKTYAPANTPARLVEEMEPVRSVEARLDPLRPVEALPQRQMHGICSSLCI